jgi:hypothetical protein
LGASPRKRRFTQHRKRGAKPAQAKGFASSQAVRQRQASQSENLDHRYGFVVREPHLIFGG